jgi:hypothetical protein
MLKVESELSEDSIHWLAVVVAVMIMFHNDRGFWGFYVSDIIDGLAEQMDRTDNRVRNETRHVTVIDRKDRTCCKFCSLVLGISLIGGPGSSVSIVTDYGLDGPDIESWWGRDISRTSRPALGPTQPPVQWVPGLSRG